MRELDNAIQRALILQQGGVIEAADLFLDRPGEAHGRPAMPAVGGETDEPSGALNDDLRHREYRLILDTLRAERGRRKETAERLGISPRTLRYKLAQMREAGLDIDGSLFG